MKYYLSNTKMSLISCLRAMMIVPLAFILSFQVHAYSLGISPTSIAEYSGMVTDESGEPLIGVNVTIKDSSVGTISDFDGKFTINAKSGDILTFSYIGYLSQEITLTDQTSLNIILAADSKTLEEVVVIGYGTQKKSHLTGSVSRVENKTLDQIPMARVDDALVGQVSGINISMTNPAAGEAPSIRVRGQGSISYDSNPLIVVDGIAVGFDADYLSSMDMNAVASIEVLKDAASAAIYGSRGANGIIMITTKEGVEGPTKFSYDTYIGFKSVPKTNILTTVDSWLSDVRAANGGELDDRAAYIEKMGTYTDWEDVMFDGGTITNHSLSARGGTKNTKFRASVNYLNDEGVLLTDNYEKINFNINLDTKVNKRVRFGVNVNPSYTKQRRFPIGVHDAIRQNPWLPLYIDEDNIQFVNRFRENGRWADVQIGDYAMERMFDDYDLAAGEPSTGSGTDISATSNQSALAKVLERNYQKFQTKILANAYVSVDIADGLTFKQTLGGDVRFTKNTRFVGVNASRNGAGDALSARTSDEILHTINESTLNYNKQFNKHEINAVGGFAFEQWQIEATTLNAAGFENDLIQTIPQSLVETNGGGTLEYEEALVSFLGRVAYSYDDKYLFSLSARRDGSSKFGSDTKYGFFPAVSAGWVVSKESFLADSDLIDQLKLRVSYGKTGSNNGIGYYASVGQLFPVGTGFGQIGFNQNNIANDALAWEGLLEINPGVDLSIMDGRFGVSLDYYQRTSDNLLLPLPIPSATGFSNSLVNQGEVKNEGYEIEFRSRNLRSKDYSWNTTVLLTKNKNTLVDFAGASGLISIADDKRAAEWIALEGSPIASFYGYVVDRDIDPENIKSPLYPINGQTQDIYVKDLNGDGVIDTDDRTVLGDPYADLIWSVNNTIEMHDFDISFMFQGSHGAQVRNISSQYINNEFSSNQDYISGFEDASLVQQRIFTSDDIQDASFIALRNVNIGYTLPRDLLSNKGIRSLRLYVGAQNLLYLMADDYVGYNPEGQDGYASGFQSVLNQGYQRGPAPIFRTISAGLNLQF